MKKKANKQKPELPMDHLGFCSSHLSSDGHELSRTLSGEEHLQKLPEKYLVSGSSLLHRLRYFFSFSEHITISSLEVMKKKWKNERRSSSIHWLHRLSSSHLWASSTNLLIFHCRNMKKRLHRYYLATIILSFCCIWSNIVLADSSKPVEVTGNPNTSLITGNEQATLWWSNGATNTQSSKSNWASTPTSQTVYTTEKVPGASCDCGTVDANGEFKKDGNVCLKVETRLYKCTVSLGMGGFQAMLKGILTYFVRIVTLLWVLAIVGLGIAWAWAGGDDIKSKSKLKWWAINIIVWMAILFFFEYILKFLAPSIFQ